MKKRGMVVVVLLVMVLLMGMVRGAVPQNGLVAYWSFDEKVSNTFPNLIVNLSNLAGNPFTLKGSAVLSAEQGISGRAADLGKTGYLDAPQTGLPLKGNRAFTVSLWLYQKGYGPSSTSLFVMLNHYQLGVNGNGYLYWGVGNDDYPLTYYIDKGNVLTWDRHWDTVSTNQLVPLNQWVHYVLVYDGAKKEARMYKDLGLPYAVKNVGMLTSADNRYSDQAVGNRVYDYPIPEVIGTLYNPSNTGADVVARIGGSNHPDMLVDEVLLYNRVLSDAEVADIYTTQLGRRPDVIDYVSRWEFDEESGTEVKDETGAFPGEIVPASGGAWSRAAVRGGMLTSFGKALWFTGSAQEHVAVPKPVTPAGGTPVEQALPPALKATTRLTVSAWVNATKMAGNVAGAIAGAFSRASSDTNKYYGWLLGIPYGSTKTNKIVFEVRTGVSGSDAHCGDPFCGPGGSKVCDYSNFQEANFYCSYSPPSCQYDSDSDSTPDTDGIVGCDTSNVICKDADGTAGTSSSFTCPTGTTEKCLSDGANFYPRCVGESALAASPSPHAPSCADGIAFCSGGTTPGCSNASGTLNCAATGNAPPICNNGFPVCKPEAKCIDAAIIPTCATDSICSSGSPQCLGTLQSGAAAIPGCSGTTVTCSKGTAICAIALSPTCASGGVLTCPQDSYAVVNGGNVKCEYGMPMCIDENAFYLPDKGTDTVNVYNTCLSGMAAEGAPYPQKINQWLHVAGVFTSNKTTTLYLDGIPVSTDSKNPIASIAYESTTKLWLGNRPDTTGLESFPGLIDDLRIYTRALSAEEIKSIYLNSDTAPCFNQYCPAETEIKALPNFDQATSILQQASTFLTLDPEKNMLQGGSLVNRADLWLLNRPSFQTVVTSAAATEALYFAFNKKNYVVSLKEQNQFAATATLSAKPLAGEEIAPLALETDAAHAFELPAKQVELNLNDEETPEVYVQALGAYQQDKKFGLLVGVTPFMDFNQHAAWTASLLSGHQQKFRMERPEPYPIRLDKLADGNYQLLIDDVPFVFAVGAEPFTEVHYFDERKTLAVKFTVKNAFGPFLLVDFERQPTAMQEIYEKAFSKTKPATVQHRLLKVCSNDPPIFAAATICEQAEELFDLLESMPKTVEEFVEVLFWYKKPSTGVLQEKSASAFHIFRFADENPHELGIFFSNNLQEGRRLALQLGEHYYLLSKATGETADLKNLKLSRITSPAGVTSYPEYAPLGDDAKVRFDLPLKKQVIIQLIAEPQLSYLIQSIVTAAPEVVQIVDALQSGFSTYSSVFVQDNSGTSAAKTLSVASDDISLLQNKMKMVYADKNLELPFGEKTILPGIKIKDGFADAKLLLQYNKFTAAPDATIQEPKFTKYADVFLLYDLDEGVKTHLFSDEKFILPLLRGRSFAIKANNNFYLFAYDQPWRETLGAGFVYTLLRLKADFNTPEEDKIEPSGVLGDVVTFKLDEATSVKLEFDTVRGKAVLSKITQEVAVASVAHKVHLPQELQSRVSSSSPITLLQSDIGTLQVHAEDVSSFSGVMRLSSDQGVDKELPLKLPVVLGSVEGGKVLAHYNLFSPSGSAYLKTADLYFLYDVDAGEKKRPFTDEDFITPLVSGKKLALQFAGKFYLLSYSGTLGTSGFSYGALRLAPFAGAEKAPEAVTENEVTFKLTEGKITLTFDTLQRVVTFSSVQEGEVIEGFVPQRDYFASLPAQSSKEGVENVLTVGTVQFWNCDSATTKEFADSFFLCTSPGAQERVERNVPLLKTVDGGQQVLLWYKEKSGTQKTVTLQYGLGNPEIPFTLDWVALLNNLNAGKNPVLFMQGTYYELTGNIALSSFALREVPSGKTYAGKMAGGKEGEQEYLILVKGRVLQLKQQLEGTTITLRFTLLPELVVPPEGLLLSAGRFKSSLESPSTTLSTSWDGSFLQTTLTQSTDAGEVQIYLNRLPPGASRRILLPHGDVVTLEVPLESSGEVVVRP